MRNLFSVTDFNKAVPDSNIDDDSIHDYFHKSVGQGVTKEITLSANNSAQSVNIFQLTGSVEIVRLYGIITDATTLVNCTNAYWDVYDSAAAVVVTKNDGALSGLGVGSLMVKNAIKTVTMAVADNAAGAIIEDPAGVKAFAPFHIIQKTGQSTYLRFTYTTTDAPINAKIYMRCRFRPLNNGTTDGTLVAV